MNETTLTKKKVAVYMAIPLVFRGVIDFARTLITNSISNKFVEFQQTKQADLINNGIYLAYTVISLALIVLFGYLLTKDKKKALVFTGTAFFGIQAASLVTALAKSICQVLVNLQVLNSGTSTTALNIFSLIMIALQVAFAVTAFTAVEGINDKLTAAENPMTLSQARKRYVIAFILTFVIGSVVNSIPSLIFSLFSTYLESIEAGYIFSAVSAVATFLSSVLAFVIMYLAGYKSSKNHNEAVRLYSSSAISAPVTAVISAFINTLANALILIITPVVPVGTDVSNIATEQYITRSYIYQAANLINFITVPAAILISLLALKLFFDNKRAFSTTPVMAKAETVADSEVQTEE